MRAEVLEVMAQEIELGERVEDALLLENYSGCPEVFIRRRAKAAMFPAR